MNLKKHIYTTPEGTKFIFVNDIKDHVLTPEQFKKWKKVSRGSTAMLIQGQLGVYPYDLEKFIRLDKLGV